MRDVKRRRASRLICGHRFEHELLNPRGVNLVEVHHADELTALPGNGPGDVRGSRRRYDFPYGTSIPQRSDLSHQGVDLRTSLGDGSIEVDVLCEQFCRVLVAPVSNELFGGNTSSDSFLPEDNGLRGSVVEAQQSRVAFPRQSD